MLRVVALVILVVFAAVAAVVALGALSNLWSGYRDSEIYVYLAIGLPALALCIASIVAFVVIWRDR